VTSPRTSRAVWILLALLASLLCGIALRIGVEGEGAGEGDGERDATSRSSTPRDGRGDAARRLSSLPDPGEVYRLVVDLTLPSLVSIDAISESISPFTRRVEEVHTLGAGFIADAAGSVLTVHHVVADAVESGKIFVTLHDGKSYLARVVGVDEFTDLAVLKIPVEGLPAAALGDSDAVRVGDVVLAFGNPLDFRETVTHGIVSGTGRPALDVRSVEDNMIQTDAAMNQGNSGGPLVDVRGRVIGVNDYIASPTGMSAGLGFTIPINTAKKVLRDISEKGHVAWGSLGVSVADLVDDAGELAGAQVVNITSGSPAQRAGLRRGDVIVGVDGSPVRAVRELRALTSSKEPGTRVSIAYVRDGTEHRVSAEVTDRRRIMSESDR